LFQQNVNRLVRDLAVSEFASAFPITSDQDRAIKSDGGAACGASEAPMLALARRQAGAAVRGKLKCRSTQRSQMPSSDSP
jgi:hypothetical protein